MKTIFTHNKALLFIASFVFICCKEKQQATYFGGEIINPISDYVVLSVTTSKDTIYLDKNNRFLIKLDSVAPKLYEFKHGSEYQSVLLEPADSVLLRLNTIEFDESLVYTGKGAKKNNYLMQDFLTNEQINKNHFIKSQLPPQAFNAYLDSIRNIRNKRFDAFIAKNKTSTLFKKIAQSSINYNTYLAKEYYPFTVYNKDEIKMVNSLPADFYNYRDSINHSDAYLENFIPYREFIRYHINNRALTAYMKANPNAAFDASKLEFNTLLLRSVHDLVRTSLKEDLLYQITYRYIYNNSDPAENNKLVSVYENLTKLPDSLESMRSFLKTTNALTPGNTLAEVEVKNAEGLSNSLQQLITNLTVLSFWSSKNDYHAQESRKKIAELKRRYPEVQFLNVNIDSDTKWTDPITGYKTGYSALELQFTNPKDAEQLLAIKSLTKVFILDKESKILSGNANLFDAQFESQLLGYLNR